MEQNEISNWDAKKVYSRYLDSGKIIPPIYIDEYWDYYIDEYDRKKHWESFLENFQNDGLTHESFTEEYNKLLDSVSKKIITVSLEDLSLKCKSTLELLNKDTSIPFVDKFNLPDGRYLQIDMHNAFDETLKYLGVFNTNYKNTYDIINNSTEYRTFHNQKQIRMNIYNSFLKPCSYDLYSIVNVLIEQIYKNENSELREFTQTLPFIGKIHGDSYLYELNGIYPSKLINEYKCGDIEYHITFLEVKELQMLGQKYKCLIWKNENDKIESITLVNQDNKRVRPYKYPFLYKLIYNKDLNEKDLVFGYENQIFSHFSKSEIYGTE